MSLFSDAAGLTFANVAYNTLGGIGTAAQTTADNLAKTLTERTQFQPFSISGPTSSASVDATGSIMLDTGGLAGAAGDALLRRSSNALVEPLGSSTLGRGGTTLANQGIREVGQDPSLSPSLVATSQSLLDRGGDQLGMQPSLSPSIQAGGQALLQSGMSGLGRSAFGLSGQEAAARDAFGLGSQFMGRAGADMGGREQEIFDRLRAMQAPEEERQRLALEERLANQGRLGVSTNMFGGTPEQFALAKAQEEAQDRAAIMAMQQAQQEQRQQADIGAQFSGLGSNLAAQRQAVESAQQQQALRALTGGSALAAQDQAVRASQQQEALRALTAGSSVAAQEQAIRDAQRLSALRTLQTGEGLFGSRIQNRAMQDQMAINALKAGLLPETIGLNALQQQLVAAQLAQRAQLEGAGMFGESTMSGINALLASGLGQADLAGDIGAALLAGGAESGGGMFGTFTNAANDVIDLINIIPGVDLPNVGSSDIRFKENIKYLTTNPNGFNIYSWDWNEKGNEVGEHGFSVGVLAQELLETHPERVIVGDDGYYRVNYDGVWR